ncbi:two-component regulator propeller domain-containing protein [Gordonia sp. CPCC 206044]
MLGGGVVAAAPAETPGLGPTGTSLMHGDLGSTDSTPFPGPGRSARLVASSVPGGACAATFVGRDGMPISLCTQFVGTSPPTVAVATVTLFDPVTAAPLARRQLTKGGLLGGVYGYLDGRDRVVVADGSGAILRVGHRKTRAGWQVYVDDRIDISRHIPAGDSVTGLAPDHDGRIWFATTHGVVGTVSPNGMSTNGSGTDRVRVRSMHLPRGENLGNGLSVRASGASILTTHALYEMRVRADGTPLVVWRRAYERGRARMPGQLTWGSGTTPTYFGPGGDGWVAIVDNAVRPQLIVYDSDTGDTVCRMPAFDRSGQGTENSPMAWGDSLVIPSTYGYQYPPMAVDGPSVPATAPFVGGSTRIDVSAQGCRRVWENRDRIATLPRLSRADGLIHALGYGPYVPGSIQQAGPIYYVATDFATGKRVRTLEVGHGPVDEPLELTGTIARDGTMWQATVGRMLKIGR